MCDGFKCNYSISFFCFTLVKTLGSFVVTNGKVSGFYKGPGQVFIAVLGIAFAFLFTIAQFFTAYTATIRSIVSDFFETFDVSCFLFPA